MSQLRFSNTLRSNMMDEISSYAGTSATLKLLSGTQPSGGGAETVVLGTLTCSASEFAVGAVNGILTLSAITGATAVATGTATWFRIETSGATWVMDGDVSLQGGAGDLQLDDTSIVNGGSLALGGPNTLTAGNAP